MRTVFLVSADIKKPGKRARRKFIASLATDFAGKDHATWTSHEHRAIRFSDVEAANKAGEAVANRPGVFNLTREPRLV